MRLLAIWLVVFFFCAYSWKDWFKGLCFLILMMAIVERPDMPKAVLGIPGLNPWNLLFLNVVAAAYSQIGSDKFKVNLPDNFRFYVRYYLFFILLAFIREVGDTQGMQDFARLFGREALGIKGLIIEDVFNTIKYAVPGLLLFYGCNSSERLKLAIWSVLLMNFLIALQIIKAMPLAFLTDGTALEQRAIRVIDRDIGYYRSDAAIFLAGAAWAMYACQYLFKKKTLRWGCMAASGLTLISIALTGGRIGQGAWIVVGSMLAWYKWRRFFLLGPLAIFVLVATIPSVQDRFTQGFTYDEEDKHMTSAGSESAGQLNSVTSGRTVIWPHVIEKIGESPFFGHGRRAMQRIGLSMWLSENLGEPFPHPHNAYLQVLLDNGFLLSIPILLFHLAMLFRSLKLFREKTDNLCIVTGALGLAAITSFLIGGVGQQSFYPVASSMGMLCAMGLVLRVFYEKHLVANTPNDLETHENPHWNNKTP